MRRRYKNSKKNFSLFVFRKTGSKNRIFREIGVKLQCSTKERETTFVSIYRKVRRNEGSRNRDSTEVILKPRILYDLDRQPSKIRNL